MAPMTRELKYYNLLGVTANASGAELKQAYKTQAMKYHPDKNPSADAEEKFKAIGAAYHVLSNPHLRAAYDRDGRTATRSVALSDEQIQQLFRMNASFAEMEATFARMDSMFTRMDASFTRMAASFTRMDSSFANMDASVANMESSIASIETSFTSALADLNAKLQGLHSDVHTSHEPQHRALKYWPLTLPQAQGLHEDTRNLDDTVRESRCRCGQAQSAILETAQTGNDTPQ
ncbi:hypothetical protein AB1N83_013937 [Pleurotus pulmonarius]